MEDYIKKAADAFLVERPYGMRVMWTRFPWKVKS